MAERVDPGARVYANALHGAAAEAERVAGVDRDLAELTQALAESRPLRRALFNPELPHAAKHRIVTRLLDQSDELLRNALLVMIDNGRLALLPDLQVAYAELAAEEERILDVDVTTAVPLDKAEVEALEKRVARRARHGRARPRPRRSRNHRRPRAAGPRRPPRCLRPPSPAGTAPALINTPSANWE